MQMTKVYQRMRASSQGLLMVGLSLLSVVVWLLLFSLNQFIPSQQKAAIRVDVLDWLDELLYGNLASMLFLAALTVLLARLSFLRGIALYFAAVPFVLKLLHFLASNGPSHTKDLLAVVPYGVIHYISPFLTFGIVLFLADLQTLAVVILSFGLQNVFGVVTQLFFPAAPPWYNDLYGYQEASYDMKGHPGGLERIDQYFQSNFYSNTFTSNPLVFGAFPSLHSAFAVWIACVLFYYANGKLRYAYVSIGILHSLSIWWSAMYFRHHYMVDLHAGMFYAIFSFSIALRTIKFLSANLPVSAYSKITSEPLYESV